MRSPTVLPALAFVGGVAIGVSGLIPAAGVPPAFVLAALVAIPIVSLGLQSRHRAGVVLSACAAIGSLHGASARESAVHSPLRASLEQAIGGFTLDAGGAVRPHTPVPLRAVLTEDASGAGEFVSLRVDARAVQIDRAWRDVSGGMVVSVNGAAGRDRIGQWRRGRTIELPVTFRRPARYLNDGVADFEMQSALGGITLLGSVKSPLLVHVVGEGSAVDEAAASLRAYVRRAITQWVAPHDPVAVAIVAAVLIGDRTGLPDAVRAQLQAAGTYHVIAISGGNIAILAGLIAGACALCGVGGRAAALAAIVLLSLYAQVASAGPSVWRATMMAVLYFGARLFDQRTPAWHTVVVTAAAIACVQPLDVRDAGYLLTFGATAGLLAVGRWTAIGRNGGGPVTWLAASLIASLAAELALLPVSASVFSRITGAGLLLNLLAVPLMAVVQVAGLAVVMFNAITTLAAPAGWVAAHAASVLVSSASLVDYMPSLVRRVAPPPGWMVVAYYAALVSTHVVVSRRRRLASALTAGVLLSFIVCGANPMARDPPVSGVRMTMIDVGQGEAVLLQSAGGDPLLIDTGGSPFGSGAFDIGARVLAPALWQRGVRSLGALLLTHADPDHIGGATAVLGDFTPGVLWWGVPVPGHVPSHELWRAARAKGMSLRYMRDGDAIHPGAARVRVLNPPEPDWERQRVRNDDSVVLEIVHGEVALLLTGDISAEVERAILPKLTPARVRVLKVAHHGSRTSSSRELLETWRPTIALISAGRGNTFGHPAPDVLARLASIGARVYRTDRDGEITLDSDGRGVIVKTFAGRGE